MPATKYQYTISTQTASGKVNGTQLAIEIAANAGIVVALSWLDSDIEPDKLDVYMVSALTGPQEAALTATVAAHQGVAEPLLNTYAEGQAVIQVDLVPAANVAIDGNLSNSFDIELDQNVTLDNPEHVVPGAIINVAVRQNGVGGWTVAFGDAFKFTGGVPTVSAGADQEDMISCYVRAVDGDGVATRMNCSIAQDVV